MHEDIKLYNEQQSPGDREICDLLSHVIDQELREAESKIWHGHPVWFMKGNPIVGYSRQKKGWRLMFWSGAEFDEDGLNVKGKKFKDASVFITSMEQVIRQDLERWLRKSRDIQWDYKNLIKRKGQFERLK